MFEGEHCQACIMILANSPLLFSVVIGIFNVALFGTTTSKIIIISDWEPN